MTAATTQTLLERAADHLTAAARLARGDDTPRSRAVAGVIELTRAGIAPGSLQYVGPTTGPASTLGRLHAALAALDTIDPLDGPPDLLAWTWQVADLIRILQAREAVQP